MTLRAGRVHDENIELEFGGEIRLDYRPLPEWASYFTRIPGRCDRCWEKTGRVSSKKGSDYHVCRTCQFRILNDSALSDWAVFKKKFTLYVKRAVWNATHENKIPNNPGWK